MSPSSRSGCEKLSDEDVDTSRDSRIEDARTSRYGPIPRRSLGGGLHYWAKVRDTRRPDHRCYIYQRDTMLRLLFRTLLWSTHS
jgi:hypothetical protein